MWRRTNTCKPWSDFHFDRSRCLPAAGDSPKFIDSVSLVVYLSIILYSRTGHSLSVNVCLSQSVLNTILVPIECLANQADRLSASVVKLRVVWGVSIYGFNSKNWLTKEINVRNTPTHCLLYKSMWKVDSYVYDQCTEYVNFSCAAASQVPLKIDHFQPSTIEYRPHTDRGEGRDCACNPADRPTTFIRSKGGNKAIPLGNYKIWIMITRSLSATVSIGNGTRIN